MGSFFSVDGYGDLGGLDYLFGGLGSLFGLDTALLAGVILVGACPGGTASNVITYLSGGDVALSVGMTSVNTVLAPCLYPGNNLPVPA